MMWRKEGTISRQFGKGIIISEGINSYRDGPDRYVGELYKATQADEALIIAAPELLGALQWFVARVDAGEVQSKRTYAEFKTLIAKATGAA